MNQLSAVTVPILLTFPCAPIPMNQFHPLSTVTVPLWLRLTFPIAAMEFNSLLSPQQGTQQFLISI